MYDYCCILVAYRRHGERYSEACVLGRDRSIGPNVMLWGIIAFHGRSELIRVQGNLTGHISRRDFGTCCGSIR